MRIAIIGNSGSGKSTLALWLANRAGVPLLDLDTVAWVPGQIAVPRPASEAQEAVRDFCTANANWVVEGCYANLVAASLTFAPTLIFLDPGEEACLAHCRNRPWESHKYASKEAQDERLPFLLSWVGDYYRRDGDMSHAGHAACFDGYVGPKQVLRSALSLDPPSSEALALAT